MSNNNQNALEKILECLLTPYKERVSDVSKIVTAMLNEGIIDDENDIANDHIAFRTLGVENLGIASFEKIFLHYGYKKKDFYHFENKKLNAYWYAPPSEKYPRIFISELRVWDLSKEVQDIIYKYTESIVSDPIDALNLDDVDDIAAFLTNPLWCLPSLENYTTLLNESEYAAWVIYNRYYLNHYTISVHDLPSGFNTIEAFNDFIEGIGITLNTSGGKIKTSSDGLLKQSSTVAKMIRAEFLDNKKMDIAGSYVEFAERKLLPNSNVSLNDKISNAYRRDGFETSNADKIFESTYTEQTILR
ncbi:DUF1338 domain-containing protein [Flavivirga spongiicola]|uniref:2-oxoadipate dioxygenase/decarboxylase n=1 Tax=Flavivirga spongiicola TaxID=421621 RepID=A0ABU7XQ40_9FLAO|nr:DUF1338 domain-containing protein [Flavivirga sp. MEBiC05379]MDO5977860.1 DUF1338 domain-containing protein [Flavivirga sp. MEBiC05379]